MAVFGSNNQAGNTNVRAVTETVEKEVVQLKLHNGTTPAGVVQTVNQNLGTLNPNAWDATKVMAITEALTSCLSKTIHAVNHVRTTSLVD